MQLTDFDFLLSPEGQTLLHATAVTPITPQNHLQIASQLRQQLPPPHAQAIIDTLILRQRATKKFGHAAEMYFTRNALEQASSEIIAMYRAQRFVKVGIQTVADLGCGIGGDALALAQHVWVLGVDLDPLRLAMARENVAAYGGAGRFQPVQADLTHFAPPYVDALFFDPARRDAQGKRIYSLHDYKPPFSLVDRWRRTVEGTAVKISPGVHYDELPPATQAEVEFISVNGEVKEGVLWFGSLSSQASRRATLLPDGWSLTDLDAPGQQVAVTTSQNYLFEPDGAVIRAHLVQALARQINATQIDKEIAYLTTNEFIKTPFGRWFALEDAFPFQLKRLRHYLRDRKIGKATIKKRGSPLDVARLQRQLKLRGDKHCYIFLTQVMGVPTVLIGQSIA